MTLLRLQKKTLGAAMLVAALVATAACLDRSRDNAGDPLHEWAASVCEVAESLVQASLAQSPGMPESAARIYANARDGYRAIEPIPGTEEFLKQHVAVMDDFRTEFETTLLPLFNATPGSVGAQEGIDRLVALSRRNGERLAAALATLPEEATEALRAVPDGCGITLDVPAGGFSGPS